MSRLTRTARVATATVLLLAAAALVACARPNTPSGAAAPSRAASSTPPASATPAPTSQVASPPASFLAYARAVRSERDSESATGTAWYPTYLPKGFTLSSVDASGLKDKAVFACGLVFSNGNRQIHLSQGSPAQRDYEIVPLATVPWGSEQAFAMDLDGQPGGEQFIVHEDAVNLAELQGDVSLAELKKIAAGMKAVP